MQTFLMLISCKWMQSLTEVTLQSRLRWYRLFAAYLAVSRQISCQCFHTPERKCYMAKKHSEFSSHFLWQRMSPFYIWGGGGFHACKWPAFVAKSKWGSNAVALHLPLHSALLRHLEGSECTSCSWQSWSSHPAPAFYKLLPHWGRFCLQTVAIIYSSWQAQ